MLIRVNVAEKLGKVNEGIMAAFMDLETARFILEKCILLTPDTEYAKQTRRELARLLGLEESDGEKLLLGSELDLIFSDAINDKDLSAMQRVMDLLSISDKGSLQVWDNGVEILLKGVTF